MSNKSVRQRSPFHQVPGHQIAPLIQLNHDELADEEIEIAYHSVSYEELDTTVTFRHVSDLLYYRMNINKMNEQKAIEDLISTARTRLCVLGIPRAAHFDVRYVKRPHDSYTDISCKFFLKPKHYHWMPWEIRQGITPGSFGWKAEKRFILASQLPPDVSSEQTNADDEKIDAFAEYSRKAMIPWEAQWLLDYSTTVDWQEFDGEVRFDLTPPEADSFYYDETLNIGCSHLPLFSYEIAPILRI